jgi:hypothetical protein
MMGVSRTRRFRRVIGRENTQTCEIRCRGCTWFCIWECQTTSDSVLRPEWPMELLVRPVSTQSILRSKNARVCWVSPAHPDWDSVRRNEHCTSSGRESAHDHRMDGSEDARIARPKLDGRLSKSSRVTTNREWGGFDALCTNHCRVGVILTNGIGGGLGRGNSESERDSWSPGRVVLLLRAFRSYT